MGGTLERHPFSGLIHSAGELLPRGVKLARILGEELSAGKTYTVLSGFRLPWPPSCRGLVRELEGVRGGGEH